ncbi:hypothetical protein CYY_000708 [Polysphondylium violaceum]|uniref:AAA+ ATPase domain-containing protein n=1 Tax=Polysphondylium violaceum TaxID=133409 RepID=A0A8J4VBA1_9MYCE|nr:hypothetical protein CYY_000708 [Polysphondylium violaceum]
MSSSLYKLTQSSKTTFRYQHLNSLKSFITTLNHRQQHNNNTFHINSNNKRNYSTSSPSPNSTTVSNAVNNSTSILNSISNFFNNNNSNNNDDQKVNHNNESSFIRNISSDRSRLTYNADQMPHDENVQELLYKELFELRDYESIIKRYESLLYASNEECVRYYFKALVYSKKIDSANLMVHSPPILNNSTTTTTTPINTSQINTNSTTISNNPIINNINTNINSKTNLEANSPIVQTASAPITSTSPNHHSTATAPANTAPNELSDIMIRFNHFPEMHERINQKPVFPVINFPQSQTMKLSKTDRFLSLLWIPVLLFFLIGGQDLLTDDDVANASAELVATEYKREGDEHAVGFDDIRGIEEVKQELMEIVDYLVNPDKYNSIGAKLPRGILLSGEPGTGKTMLARAIAKEAGVTFLYTSGSSFDEKYVGVGAKRVRSLFKTARTKEPCIIFIDEIDSVGKSRNQTMHNETLLQLLAEMDGFDKNHKIMIIGATNAPESLDSALTRPGRLDRHISVPVPDVKGRSDIVQLYLSKIKYDKEKVNPNTIAKATPGFTGADLSNLINTAAIKAVQNGLDTVSNKHIEEARDDILMGRARTTGVVNEETRINTAFHEAGHAIVAALSEGADPIHKATIVQRGHALGMVSQLPESSDNLQITRKQMMTRLAICLAGRAAEEVFFGEDNVTTGASSDFQQATQLAFAMITKWGMSDKLGFTYHKEKMSPEIQNIVDNEVKALLDKQYKIAKQLILNNKDKIENLANTLLEKETLSGEEILNILEVKPKEKKQSIFANSL